MFDPVRRSLQGMLGAGYTDRLKESMACLFGADVSKTDALVKQEVDFFPKEYEEDLNSRLCAVGTQVIAPFESGVAGAATDSFRNATRTRMSPVGGKGFYRIGEDGRLYFTSKSEHYHASLGHHFPGYKLVENARAAGVMNATHNNTRGYITRLLEQELVRVANGIKKEDAGGLERVLRSEESHVLNRVINLETGSLGVEAGVKMMLARFYRLEESSPMPKYAGRTPVFFVMEDHAGGKSANYHGTTVLTQTMRGLWPEVCAQAKAHGLYEVVTVKINDLEDFRSKMRRYDQGGTKVAGFLHEIVLMNYGAVKMTPEYLQEAYRECRLHDVPALVDEIQSCIWYPGLFLYREYGLQPDFVVIGKGFSGGEYPASKILTTKEMDNLNQFGALVTNGQEELASLSYLVTMEFALHNAEPIRAVGRRYTQRLQQLAAEYPQWIEKIEGHGHLLAVHFKKQENAAKFANILNDQCIDVSVHGYKAVSLPAVLTKLPLIATEQAVDFIAEKMRDAASLL